MEYIELARISIGNYISLGRNSGPLSPYELFAYLLFMQELFLIPVITSSGHLSTHLSQNIASFQEK